MAPRLTVEQRIAEARAEAAKMAVDDYKQRVLAVAQDHKDSLNWCDSGFRAAMEELGIEVKGSYRVTLAVEVVVHEQINEDEAGDFAASMMSDQLSFSRADNFSLDSVDVEEVAEET